MSIVLSQVRAVLTRLDVALWRLPRSVRRALVLPLAVLLATRDFARKGWGEGRRASGEAWSFVMDHVEERPTP